MIKNIVLYLIRHGESEYNSQGVIQGHRDVPLSGKGKEQAQLLGKRLRKICRALDRIITSDLMRAEETAKILQEHLPSPLAADPRWREIFWGNWEGRGWAEIMRDPEFKRYVEQWYTYRDHGGESWAQTASRVREALAEIEETCPGQRLLIVTHGGTIRMTLIEALKLPPRYYPFSSDNTSITELTFEEKRWKLKRLNDAGHLEGTPFEDCGLAGDSQSHETSRR